MRIRLRLLLSRFVPIAIAVLSLSWILVWASRQVNTVIAHSSGIDQAVKGVFELNSLTSDYLLYHTERAAWSRVALCV